MNILRKKLLYMSTHRGCKEMDILLSHFANDYLYKMNSAELNIYAKLLAESDTLLYEGISQIIHNQNLNSSLIYCESLLRKIAKTSFE